MMIAYKLFSLKSNGELGSLFINKRARYKVDKWYEAEDHKTKGYYHRPGFHACIEKEAPHLSEKDRVWKKIEVLDYQILDRPKGQGKWVLANRMRIIE